MWTASCKKHAGHFKLRHFKQHCIRHEEQAYTKSETQTWNTAWVEKAKGITIADLNKVVNLTKKLRSGGQLPDSNLTDNLVITKLLQLVAKLKQGDFLPTAQFQASIETSGSRSRAKALKKAAQAC